MSEMKQNSISRRNLLKLISAAGGAIALANLPVHWLKPSVKMGLLPVHAQSSGTHVVTAAASIDDVSFCYDLLSTATIAPVEAGIELAYVISFTGSASITSPSSLTGTQTTDSSGAVSLTITPNTSLLAMNDRVIVTWSFVHPADGANNSQQYFNNIQLFCD
jgi:hypothetical protein